jgi:hypothetical protein
MTKESNRKGMGTTIGEQERSAAGQQLTGGERGRPMRERVVWAILMAFVVIVAVLGVLIVVVLGVLLLRYAISNLPLFRAEDYGVTFLDLLKALALPITLGAVVPLIGWLQSKREREARAAQRKRELELEQLQREREREAQAAQRERELEIENQRAETDRQIAAQGRQDDRLQAYIDQIGQLLLDKDRPLLRSATVGEVRPETNVDEVRTLARAQTLTVLPRLDGERKRSVLQFLYESHLIIKGHVVVPLRGADLRGASLDAANLSAAHLSTTDLMEASLDAANLRGGRAERR